MARIGGNHATDFDGGYVVVQRLVKAAAVIGSLAFIIVAIPALPLIGGRLAQ